MDSDLRVWTNSHTFDRKATEIVDLTEEDETELHPRVTLNLINQDDADDEIKILEEPHSKRQKILPSSRDLSKKEQEARSTLFRSKPSKTFLDRLRKAQSDRLFLIRQQQHSKESLEREFVIYGVTGNVYNVKIGQKPSCNCEDNKNGQAATHCEHIIFVLLKIFHLGCEDHLIWQKTLSLGDLKTIFSSFTPIHSSLLADPAVTEKYLEIMRAEKSRKRRKHAAQKPVEGDCPICFEKMTASEELVFCKYSCGNSLHKSCFAKWQDSRSEESQEVKCIYCRARWDQDYEALKKAHTKNGYLNLSAFHERASLLDLPPSYLILLPSIMQGIANRGPNGADPYLIQSVMNAFSNRLPFWDSDSDDDDDYTQFGGDLEEDDDDDSDDSDDDDDDDEEEYWR